MLLDHGWKFSVQPPIQFVNEQQVKNWQWTSAPDASKLDNETFVFPTDDAKWNSATPNEDTFNGRVGYAWYRATLPALSEKFRVLAVRWSR